MLSAFIQRKNLLPALSLVLAISYLSYVSIPLIFIGAENKQREFRDIPLQVAVPTQIADKKLQDFLEISNWHLFGQDDIASVSSTDTLPETQLQMKLQGVFTISEPINYAHAIIQTSDQIQKTYKINDTLPGGATLKAIENDKVIILRNNRQESLSMERQKPE